MEVLQERCQGGHKHEQLIGKGACSRAARYPPGLCLAIVKGIQVISNKRKELDSALEMIEEARWNESMGGGTVTGPPSCGSAPDLCPEDVLYEVEQEDMCEQDPSTWEDLATQRWQEYSQFSNETVDSTTGEILDPAKVKAGCDEELGFMSHMHVWDKVTREQAQSDPDGKIVGTRWVFVKKGDKVRCRLVAQEFAGSDKREDLYAGTPPLSATRYLLSDSVSRGRKNKLVKLMVVDVKRAFLHGYCTRSVYIELPEAESRGVQYVVKLVRALFGPREGPLASLMAVKRDRTRRLGVQSSSRPPLHLLTPLLGLSQSLTLSSSALRAQTSLS